MQFAQRAPGIRFQILRGQGKALFQAPPLISHPLQHHHSQRKFHHAHHGVQLPCSHHPGGMLRPIQKHSDSHTGINRRRSLFARTLQRLSPIARQVLRKNYPWGNDRQSQRQHPNTCDNHTPMLAHPPTPCNRKKRHLIQPPIDWYSSLPDAMYSCNVSTRQRLTMLGRHAKITNLRAFPLEICAV